MSRFTYKDSKGNYQLDNDYVCEKGIDENGLDDITDYVGELEDLEEQIGCSLDVREKAFKDGFYDIDGNHYICEHYVPYLKSMHTRGIMTYTEKHFKLKDYKKTWWLKEDRSE